MHKKSQAALEFLTTYAWAFLIILIMIAALAYFGIFQPGKLLPDRCNFGTEIDCIDYRVTAPGTDTFDLRLKNSLGEPIVIPAVATNGIKLSSDTAISFDCTLDAATGINGGAPPANYNWATDSITDFKFTSCTPATAGFLKDENAKVFITITYHLAKTSTTYLHEVSGEVFTTVT
jgi:hypothetical protein